METLIWRWWRSPRTFLDIRIFSIFGRRYEKSYLYGARKCFIDLMLFVGKVGGVWKMYNSSNGTNDWLFMCCFLQDVFDCGWLTKLRYERLWRELLMIFCWCIGMEGKKAKLKTVEKRKVYSASERQSHVLSKSISYPWAHHNEKWKANVEEENTKF